MAVGTGAISLTDVIAEITGLQSSLQDCVDDSNSDGFNISYGTPPITSLAEFRGYNHTLGTISASPTTFNVLSTASSVNVSITSNTTWTFTSSVAWLSVSGASGSGNDSSVSINVSSNGSASSRFGTITFSTLDGNDDIVVTVNQTGTA